MDTVEKLASEKGAVQSEAALAGQWLKQLDAALQSGNQATVESLFATDGHWRDLLAFTWSITPSVDVIADARYEAGDGDTRLHGVVGVRVAF